MEIKLLFFHFVLILVYAAILDVFNKHNNFVGQVNLVMCTFFKQQQNNVMCRLKHHSDNIEVAFPYNLILVNVLRCSPPKTNQNSVCPFYRLRPRSLNCRPVQHHVTQLRPRETLLQLNQLLRGSLFSVRQVQLQSIRSNFPKLPLIITT